VRGEGREQKGGDAVVADATTLHPICLHIGLQLSPRLVDGDEPQMRIGAITVVEIIAVPQANCLSFLSTHTLPLCGLSELLTLNTSVTVWRI